MFENVRIKGLEQLDRIAGLLDEVTRKAPIVNREVAERFRQQLIDGYNNLGSVDAPDLAESHPHVWKALRDEIPEISRHILIDPRDSGRAQVYFDPKATTRSGVRVLDLALIIEYGIADRGIPSFMIFHTALDQLTRG